jgi:hypothetical protein
LYHRYEEDVLPMFAPYDPTYEKGNARYMHRKRQMERSKHMRETIGLELRWLDTALRADKEVVMAALRCSRGLALQFASPEMVTRDVALAAVRECGLALGMCRLKPLFLASLGDPKLKLVNQHVTLKIRVQMFKLQIASVLITVMTTNCMRHT